GKNQSHPPPLRYLQGFGGIDPHRGLPERQRSRSGSCHCAHARASRVPHAALAGSCRHERFSRASHGAAGLIWASEIMAFRFVLAPLLRLRQSIERQRALALQEANLKVSRAQETLAQLERFLSGSAQSDSAALAAGRTAAELQFA